VTNLVDAGASAWQGVLDSFGKDIAYQGYGLSVWQTIRAFMRGPTPEELFGGALQTDVMVFINAAAFATMLPGRPRPLKFDKLRTLGNIGMAYTVESWRGAPAYGADPVVLKLTVRGGSQ